MRAGGVDKSSPPAGPACTGTAEKLNPAFVAHGHVSSFSSLNLRGSAVNAIVSHPAVDVASVVANLKSATVHGFDEVQVISTSDFDKNDVVRLKRRRVTWLKSHQVAVVDFAAHGLAARANFDGFDFTEGFDGEFGPTHFFIGERGFWIEDREKGIRNWKFEILTSGIAAAVFREWEGGKGARLKV